MHSTGTHQITRLLPILCVADCETLTGPDLGWAIAGLVLALAGAAAVVWSRR